MWQMLGVCGDIILNSVLQIIRDIFDCIHMSQDPLTASFERC